MLAIRSSHLNQSGLEVGLPTSGDLIKNQGPLQVCLVIWVLFNSICSPVDNQG